MGTSKPERNKKLYDKWSLVHLVTGVFLGWVMTPGIAVIIMVGWEPLEIFVLSPLLARFQVVFGFESLQNSLSDIVVDIVGVAIGFYIVLQLVSPPFKLF